MDGGPDGPGRPDPGRKPSRAAQAREGQIGGVSASSHHVYKVHSDIQKIGGLLRPSGSSSEKESTQACSGW